MRQRPAFFIAAAVLLLTTPALAAPAGGGLGRGTNPRPTDDFGIDFVRIGSPGNRATIAAEVPNDPSLFTGRGAVDYRYRMARQEISCTQWYEFVQAFAPHVGPVWDRHSQFLGGAAIFQGYANGMPQYTFNTPAAQGPINVGWAFAARYANWLHNGQATTAESFQTGAYDLPPLGSTFDAYPARHLEGARFWIPTLDEWVKATHYDPNRYGEGMEGYWLHPNASQTPLTPGPPGTPGAETSAGWPAPPSFPLGLYPDVAAPWGLLDVSGGAHEWTETVVFGGTHRFRAGSRTSDPGWQILDRLDGISFGPQTLGDYGVRLASAIPAPAPCGAFVIGAQWLLRRRRE